VTDRALSMLVHGGARVGKTTLAYTAPYPRLVLDAEKGSRFVKANKKKWDPLTEAPPVADGSWDTVVVKVTSFDVVLKTYEWLRSGQHQFRSVIVDSISELQVQAQEQIVGRNKMQTQDWGTLLQRLGAFCRDLRDLPEHDNQPIEAVIVIAMSRLQDGVVKPFLQGSIAQQIPYWYDITGYLYVEPVMDPSTQQWVEVRRLLTHKTNDYEAGSRVPDLPVVLDNPNIEQIIDSVFGPREEVPLASES